MIKDVLNNIPFTGISTDTRTLVPGNLFFAIRGEQFDGHDYIDVALRKGAAGVVVSKPHSSALAIQVEETVKSLGELTSAWRKKFTLPLIALTGSNGKTTTKNMIASVLGATEKPVLFTQGNLNNHIGVPLTLANLDTSHAYAVIEMGMNHLGEISYLSQLALPDIALITNAGPCHLEGVGGEISGVAKAKGEIFEGLSDNGVAIINQDDAFAGYWKNLIKDRKKPIRLVTFGFDASAEVRAEQKTLDQFILHHKDQTISISLKLCGKHNVYNALAAAAVGLVNKLSLVQIKQGLENITPAKGRMEIKSGVNEVTLIDDTYNANPLSLKAAIETVKSLENVEKKILILGDMRELGEQSIKLHEECGQFAKANGIDVLWATGDLSRHAVSGFGGNARFFDTQSELIKALLENPELLNKNNLILVKGSRSMAMEKVVEALLQNVSII